MNTASHQPYSDALTLGSFLRDLARMHDATEALVDAAKRLTYTELDRASALLARQLLTMGLGKGSRVGILLPNGVDWLTVFTATGRIGAVAVPISTLAQPPELAWILRVAAIDLVVASPSYLGHDYVARCEDAVPELRSTDSAAPLFAPSAPRLRHIVMRGDVTAPWAAPLPTPTVDDAFLTEIEAGVAPHDPLVVIHTSGSTAEPKGVVHAHGSFLGHTGAMARHYVPQAAGDRVSSPRPWFWVAGLAADLFYALHSGCTFVAPEDSTASCMAALVERERLDYVGGSLPLFRQLAVEATLAARGVECLALGIDLAGVAVRIDGGVRFRSERLESRIPASSARRLDAARFPNLFGMTEAIGSHSALPHGTQVPVGREGASGPPVPGMEHRIVDPHSREELGPGQEGELLIRGRSLMLGLDRRDRADVFEADGWYATGDVCRRDADGWVTFRSRLGDMVKVSGANVAPLEVERALHGHDSVEEAAVVGIEGPTGVVLTAFVVPVDGRTVDGPGLQAWLRARLSSYKVPKRIVVVGRDDLPRTASGKVRKNELRARR